MCGTPCPAVWPAVNSQYISLKYISIPSYPGDQPPRVPTAQAQEAVQEAGEGGVQSPDAHLRPRAPGRDAGPGPLQEVHRPPGPGQRVAEVC